MDKEQLKRYFRIFDDVMVRGKSPSKEDLKFFSEFSTQIDEDVLNQVQESSDFSKDTDFQAAIDQFKRVITSPEAKSNFLDKAQQLATEANTGKAVTAANIGLGLAELATSMNQIKAADKAVARSRRPARPTPLTADPLLQQQIADAQQGTFDAARRVAPAQQAIMDQYLSDLNQAQVASAGQAGTYGALAQVASNRRGRNNLQLAPIIDEIRAREQGRLDNLTGMKLAENQAIQQSQAQFYPQDLRQYQMEQEAAASLGATGRQNLMGSLARFGNDVVPVAANFATRRRFDNIRNAMSGVAPEYVDARIQAEQDRLMRAMENRMNPRDIVDLPSGYYA